MLGLFLFGCSSVDLDAGLKEAFDGMDQLAPATELVRLPGRTQVPLSNHIELGTEGYRIRGKPLVNADVATTLLEVATTTKDLAMRAGGQFGFTGELYVSLHPNSSAEQVTELLRSAYKADLKKIRFLARSTEPNETISYANPGYAEWLHSEVAGLAPAQRQVVLEEIAVGLMGACPDGKALLGFVQNASYEMKSAALQNELSNAMSWCLFSSKEKVLTVFQVMVRRLPYSLSVVPFTLDSEGPPFVLKRGSTWADIAPRLQKGAVRGWVVLEPEEEAQ